MANLAVRPAQPRRDLERGAGVQRILQNLADTLGIQRMKRGQRTRELRFVMLPPQPMDAIHLV
jgi:hypothetical protein